MRKIREVLRLTHELGLSVREVSKATGVGKTSVGEFVARAKVIGITWPIPAEINTPNWRNGSLHLLAFTRAQRGRALTGLRCTRR